MIINGLQAERNVSDLNSPPAGCLVESRSRESRKACFLADRRAGASAAVRKVRIQLSDAESFQELLGLGPVPLHAFRSAHLPGEPARHRGVLEVAGATPLRDGHPWVGFQKQPRLRQSKAGLARLLRASRHSHVKGEEAVCEGTIHRGDQSGRLRSGRVGCRPLHVAVSMGEVSPSEVGGEAPRHDRPQRPNPRFRRRHRGEGPRRERPGLDRLRGGSLLRDESK